METVADRNNNSHPYVNTTSYENVIIVGDKDAGDGHTYMNVSSPQGSPTDISTLAQGLLPGAVSTRATTYMNVPQTQASGNQYEVMALRPTGQPPASTPGNGSQGNGYMTMQLRDGVDDDQYTMMVPRARSENHYEVPADDVDSDVEEIQPYMTSTFVSEDGPYATVSERRHVSPTQGEGRQYTSVLTSSLRPQDSRYASSLTVPTPERDGSYARLRGTGQIVANVAYDKIGNIRGRLQIIGEERTDPYSHIVDSSPTQSPSIGAYDTLDGARRPQQHAYGEFGPLQSPYSRTHPTYIPYVPPQKPYDTLESVRNKQQAGTTQSNTYAHLTQATPTRVSSRYDTFESVRNTSRPPQRERMPTPPELKANPGLLNGTGKMIDQLAGFTDSTPTSSDTDQSTSPKASSVRMTNNPLYHRHRLQREEIQEEDEVFASEDLAARREDDSPQVGEQYSNPLFTRTSSSSSDDMSSTSTSPSPTFVGSNRRSRSSSIFASGLKKAKKLFKRNSVSQSDA